MQISPRISVDRIFRPAFSYALNQTSPFRWCLFHIQKQPHPSGDQAEPQSVWKSR
nr:MAG TPA: hypothetical protein [Caudoviricetes sp.]